MTAEVLMLGTRSVLFDLVAVSCFPSCRDLVDTLLLFGLADLCDLRFPLVNADPNRNSFHGIFLGLL